MATLFCIIPLKKIGGYFARWLVFVHQMCPKLFQDSGVHRHQLPGLPDSDAGPRPVLTCAITQITRKPSIALGKPQAALCSQACESGTSMGCAGEGHGESHAFAPVQVCIRVHFGVPGPWRPGGSLGKSSGQLHHFL